jgi:hypothetical protein
MINVTKEQTLEKVTAFLAAHQRILDATALNELSKLEYDENTKIDESNDDQIEIYSHFCGKYYKAFIIHKDGTFMAISGHLTDD